MDTGIHVIKRERGGKKDILEILKEGTGGERWDGGVYPSLGEGGIYIWPGFW